MDIRDLIGKAKVRLISKSPFWATLVLNSPLEVTDRVPTAATDGKTIFVNPQFAADLTPNQMVFLLAHEAGHIMLLHVQRMKGLIPNVANKAADYVLNALLEDDGFEFIPGGLLDPQYTGAMEPVYYRLLKEQEDSSDQGGGGGKGEGEADGLGDDLLPSNMTDAEAAEHAQKVRGMVAQAAALARQMGRMPAHLARVVGDVLSPPTAPLDLLRNYMQQVVRDDESWSRRNRRFSGQYLPDRHSVKLGPIGIIVDTSGSIGEDEINAAIADIREIAEALEPERIYLIGADAAVTSEQELERGEEVRVKLQGGGGTDMRVPLEHVAQYEPCVVVLITDGYTPWPDGEPDYPLIVCCTTGVDVPVGQVVRTGG